MEAEGWEREAREKNLSVTEVEEKRIRGNRRRSRRSKGGGEGGSRGGVEEQYRGAGDSGLLWAGKYRPRYGAPWWCEGGAVQCGAVRCSAIVCNGVVQVWRRGGG